MPSPSSPPSIVHLPSCSRSVTDGVCSFPNNWCGAGGDPQTFEGGQAEAARQHRCSSGAPRLALCRATRLLAEGRLSAPQPTTLCAVACLPACLPAATAERLPPAPFCDLCAGLAATSASWRATPSSRWGVWGCCSTCAGSSVWGALQQLLLGATAARVECRARRRPWTGCSTARPLCHRNPQHPAPLLSASALLKHWRAVSPPHFDPVCVCLSQEDIKLECEGKDAGKCASNVNIPNKRQ